MHLFTALTALLLASPAICARTSENPPGKNAILLSNVDALTLRANRMTTSRRVSPMPQLTCTGPSKKICAMYPIEIMRCKNEGYDYDAEDVQWTCVASLPAEFKLGSTDVVCEGYRNADDKWVLKGSCGVEYRMLLTELGEEKYGKQTNSNIGIMGWFETIFFFGFIAVVFLIIFAAATGIGGNRRQQERRGWGGFWGGGGGGGGGYPPGPPPPYSRFSDSRFSSSRDSDSKSWKPGFWTGVLSGAAAGYGMGRRSGNGGRSNNYDNGEGSSRSARSPGFSSPTSSTGFGSTRRR
ncbi:uncharacterized protein N7498_004826 [Penicillium cinerascens]|uniref:Store-operated calcium entry-associated regulatory factor n=1 Tax=Penicillium cinerascens TaxID=70096 RepID=A0A9W9MML2_9EURO|nr:uncharacterized protein N7498_004826 [Penicillium cinerascens]KAJ5203947.1 hypothetical protein N7498_004826 [Penicillium cinerascens]